MRPTRGASGGPNDGPSSTVAQGRTVPILRQPGDFRARRYSSGCWLSESRSRLLPIFGSDVNAGHASKDVPTTRRMPQALHTQVMLAPPAGVSSAIRQSASRPHRGQKRGMPPIVSRSNESRTHRPKREPSLGKSLVEVAEERVIQRTTRSTFSTSCGSLRLLDSEAALRGQARSHYQRHEKSTLRRRRGSGVREEPSIT